MNSETPILPSDTETIAELRELYRAAEARAARLRLLSTSGRELAEADPVTLDDILQRCGERLAFFIGSRGATFVGPQVETGLPISAPGSEGAVLARLRIDGLASLDAIEDHEDREAVWMELDLMGATIDRIRRERERAELLAALQQREKSLEQMVEKIFTAQEEERRRVAHDLHDGVAQTATALVRMLEGNEASATAEIARGLVSELRGVIAGLRPTLLDDLGLVAALQSLAEGLEAEGFTIRERLSSDDERLPPLVETALFRVAQEAFANIRKHAGGPCEVILEAELSKDAAVRVLRITDFGQGPSAETLRGEFGRGEKIGIEVMKERMVAIGGSFAWRALDEGGVVVEARLAGQD